MIKAVGKNGVNVFMDNFIGTSEFAEDCRLVNKEVLRLRLSKKTNTLKASAAEQLIIENNALGYILKYDLTRFEYNFDTQEFLYQGYPFFEEMVTTKKSSKKMDQTIGKMLTTVR
jgi:hypothetical protein